MVSEQASATRLSRHSRAVPGKRALLSLAWPSLQWLSIMTLVSSCIVADPPTYTDPGVTRPELAAYGAKPPVYLVVVVQSSDMPTFSVPVRSEDAGDQLVANFYLDYGTSNATYLGNQLLPPSTYNDTSDREISFTWTTVAAFSTQSQKGCHSVSAVVAHFKSFSMNTQHIEPDVAERDAALITWWVNVNPDPGALTTLLNCPTQQQVVAK
jgi:hypothetical protein